jgi:hypothetical protein
MRDQEFETVQVRGDETGDNFAATQKMDTRQDQRSTDEIRRAAAERDARAATERDRAAALAQARNQPDQRFAETRDEVRRPASQGGDMLSMLADIHARLDAVEKRSAETQAIVNTAKERGDVGLDTAHVAHIMQKHFFHDQPEVPDEEKPVARFDPFTGEPIAPINPPAKFDPATGARLQ